MLCALGRKTGSRPFSSDSRFFIYAGVGRCRLCLLYNYGLTAETAESAEAKTTNNVLSATSADSAEKNGRMEGRRAPAGAFALTSGLSGSNEKSKSLYHGRAFGRYFHRRNSDGYCDAAYTGQNQLFKVVGGSDGGPEPSGTAVRTYIAEKGPNHDYGDIEGSLATESIYVSLGFKGSDLDGRYFNQSDYTVGDVSANPPGCVITVTSSVGDGPPGTGTLAADGAWTVAD